MSFRIAGIKILDGCESCVRKKLKVGRVFLFSSRYEEDKDDELMLVINGGAKENSYAQRLYNIARMESTLEVSVNAIVGQNGDGKSSLLEVMLRVLNNFAYTQGFLEDQPTLEYVEGVNAILYYEIDSVLYAIKCNRDGVTWYKNGDELMLSGDDVRKKKSLRDNYMPDLFYTMVINYSLYAYTAASLGGRNNGDGYWIDGLFHKNDSYQTPIVLNPMRTSGNIDVIREGYLSKQRLMSIFANSSGEEKERMVSKNEMAVGYAFSLEKESKFIKKTICGYFMDTFQDELIWGDLSGYEYSGEKIPRDFIEAFKNFWSSFQVELADNPELVKVCSQILSSRKRARKTDLRRYLILINNTAYPTKPINNRRDGGFGREFRNLISSRNGELYSLNYKQFYRLLLIFLIWRVLAESNKFGMRGARLNDALADTRNPRNASMLYLVYKFISIAEKYKGLCNAYYLTEENYLPLIREWPNRDALGTIRIDLDHIMATNDYRTLKFKQTVNYLKQGKEYYDAQLCKFPHLQYDFFLSFDDMNRQVLGFRLKKSNGAYLVLFLREILYFMTREIITH